MTSGNKQTPGPFDVASPGRARLVVLASAALALAVGVGVSADALESRKAAATAEKEQIAAPATLAQDIGIVLGTFQIIDGGVDGRHGALPVTFTNNGSQTRHFRTTIEATGRSGVVLHTESIAVQGLEPGASRTETAFGGVPQEQIAQLTTAQFLITGTEGAAPFRP